MKSYSQSAGYAEQAIQAIKVVAAYGQEILELETFSKFLYQTKETGEKLVKLQTRSSVAYIMAMSMYTLYALLIGGILLIFEVRDINGDILSGGDIVACYNAILIGVFGFFAIFPMFKTFSEGKSAAYEIFQIIERQPRIELIQENT
mmetsp:Transcript_8283/g.6175  ORF Transcript_8283/g.6175 Transcript_8283/m.6175 type:complete len:147 (+) Transcript_8283:684-1124(+)